MAWHMFAAIHVSSGEASMKVYEVSKKNGLRQVDFIKSYIELGADSFAKGYIDHSMVFELCRILSGFAAKLEEYRIQDYCAYATGAICEAGNCQLILDQIRIRTGLTFTAVSNAPQRFLVLRSLASVFPEFDKITMEGAVIVDMVGTGSIQLTVYEAGVLIFTQNLRLGPLRIREVLGGMEERSTEFLSIMEDYIGNDIDTLALYFENHRGIRHLLFTGEELLSVMKIAGEFAPGKAMKKNKFDGLYGRINKMHADEIAEKYSLPYEVAGLLGPTLSVYRGLLEITGASRVWAFTTDLCDGIAWDYYEKNVNAKPAHDFQGDILGYARVIAAKYQTNSRHTANVEQLAMLIFDAVRRYSSLSERDRLLLRMACILHDIGKYVNMANGTGNSFRIVQGTEFIGISEEEKQIIAYVIKYNSWPHVPGAGELEDHLPYTAYITMLKLAAILRLANAIDRSHRQKVKKILVNVKGKKLSIRADTIYDITLEQTIVEDNGAFFEEVYGLVPQLRRKRR